MRARRTTAIAALLAGVLTAAGTPAQPGPRGPSSTPPWQQPSPWPDRVVVTPAQDPARSFSVTWRTTAGVESARAEIVAATARSRFDLDARAVDAVSETVDPTRKRVAGQEHTLRWTAGLEPVRYHSRTFDGLEPDTLYAYRVMGADEHWSAWMQTRTAPAAGGGFRFLYFGDAQDGIMSHWPRVIRSAFAAAPDARFAIHAGDLVNIGSRDFEWAAWFEAVGFVHGMIPAVPVVGNHEYFDALRDAEGEPLSSLSALWRPQFTLPRTDGLPEALDETVYAVRYGNVLVLVLDTMAESEFAAQAQWLEDELGRSDATWHVVTMHHPLFDLLDRTYPGAVDTGPERRELFLPVLERHGVDLVLQGHDHSYGRGSIAADGRASRRPRSGRRASTVFVTSSAGAKMYEIREDAWGPFAADGARLERRAENTQFFQVVDVGETALEYRAYTATGLVYDAFRLEKSGDGPNRLVELPVDVDDERTFDSTGAYRDGRYDVVPAAPSP